MSILPNRKAVICSLLLSLSIATGQSAVANNEKTGMRNLPRISGVVLFKLKKNKSLDDLQAAMENNFAENIDVFESQKISSSSLYEFNFSSVGSTPSFMNGTEEDFANKLIETGIVEFAEPDYIHTPDIAANDPQIPTQWYLEKIGAPAAWDITTGSNKVQVLVCDTGVLSSHPDLLGNISSEGHNFVDDSNKTEPTGNGHGTLVSGVIGAKGNNGIGIAGINWNITIVPGKISNDARGSAQTSTMVKCIQWAVDHHIRIVNLSYSGTESQSVVDASKTLYENNGMLFDTIGNTGVEVTYPNNPYAITVGSTDYYDFKSYYANKGVALDIAAPGASILSTDSNGGYKSVQGTSFSAPLVSGTAALLLALNPRLTMDDVRDILFDSAKDLGNAGVDIAYGHGRLDIPKALLLYKEKYSNK